MNRLVDLQRFYALIADLERRVGGKRTLANFGQYRDWPPRGVYFFFEPSEERTDSGSGPRIVRVGTHALRDGSRSTLRRRLGQHRGQAKGGGNHRGSIFRLLVGQALSDRGDVTGCHSWGVKGDPTKASAELGIGRDELKQAEAPVEQAVSRYIGAMQFLWLDVGDEPGPSSFRGVVERNSIALLSNHDRTPFDLPSRQWLGHHSNRPLVRESGLWNQRHVEESHDSAFLEVFEALVLGVRGSTIAENPTREVE